MPQAWDLLLLYLRKPWRTLQEARIFLYRRPLDEKKDREDHRCPGNGFQQEGSHKDRPIIDSGKAGSLCEYHPGGDFDLSLARQGREKSGGAFDLEDDQTAIFTSGKIDLCHALI
jgi:hypothetical protein